MSAGEEYLKWMGQFPVISLTLRSMKQATWELSFEMLKKAIREEYSRHWKTVEASGRLNDADRERFQRIRDLKGTDADYADALKFLSECLYICTGKKTIILIDEYDAVSYTHLFRRRPQNELERGGRSRARADQTDPESSCPNCHRSWPVSSVWANFNTCPRCV